MSGYPLTCEVQVGFDDHVSVYAIDLDTVDTIMAIDNLASAIDMVLDGTYVDHQTEGEVFVDVSGIDDGSHDVNLQEFQQALADWYNENEAAIVEAGRRREDYI